jgi:ABC-type nitrate/sulfonate/bicarbonate transport system permease component
VTAAATRRRLEFALTTVAILALWELAPWLGVPVFILPPPHRILAKLAVIYPSVLFHSAITLVESILGFVLAFLFGFPLAVGIVHSRFMERTVYPYVVAIRLVPIIAVAPLMVIWFGIGLTPKIVVSALLAFFPIVVNSVTGLRSGATEALRLMQSLKATRSQTFWKIRLYASLPYLFSALRVSATLAVIGAIVGEFVGGSDNGLGAMMLRAEAFLYTDELFVGVVFSAILGLLLFGAVALIERRVLFWHESISSDAA